MAKDTRMKLEKAGMIDQSQSRRRDPTKHRCHSVGDSDALRVVIDPRTKERYVIPYDESRPIGDNGPYLQHQ